MVAFTTPPCRAAVRLNSGVSHQGLDVRKSVLAVTTLFALAYFPALAQDRPQLADIAARQTLALYKSGGLIALITNSEDCYEHITDKFYCVYLDIAAHQVDQSSSKKMESQPHPYFDIEQSSKRIRPALISTGMSAQDAYEFLRSSFSLIELALEKNADG